MKKIKIITALALTIIMIVGILAVTPISAGATTSGWKTAYISEINNINKYYTNAYFWLIDFDNNDTPELICDTRVVIGGTYLLNYKNGINKYNIGTGWGELYKNGNLLYSSGYSVGSGVRTFEVTKISNNTVTNVFDGFYSTNAGMETDPEKYRYYIKYSNTNKQVSRSKFYSELNSCFNKSSATNLYNQNHYTYSQAVNAISNYAEKPVITSVTYSSGNITVKWDKGDDYGAQKYEVARIRTGDSSYTYFTTTTNSLTENNVIRGKTYTYQVRKYNYVTQTYGKWSSSKSITIQSDGKSGKTGSCTWSLSNGTLTITGNGAMGDQNDYVYHSDTGTYSYNLPWGKEIKKVVIGSGVTRIGAASFHYCKNLSSVTLPSSLKEIGDKAFNGCSALKSFTIPANVTKIGLSAFRACTGLTSITLDSSLKTIGETAFYYCSNVKSVTIPKSVTQIGKMAFGYNSSTKKIDNFKIYGYKGTAAETYAKSNGMTFVRIGETIYPTSVSLSKTSLTLGKGSSQSISATVYPSDATDKSVAWSSSNSSVASVSGGTINAKSTGKATITARTSNGKTATCSVTVVEKTAAPTLSLSNTTSGLTASWNKISNASYYLMYYRSSNVSSWSGLIATGTSHNVPDVKSGTLYYVQVQSVGAKDVMGNYSKVKSMTYLSRATITGLSYNGNNTLTWGKVGGANKYQIARIKKGETSYTYFYTTGTSFTENNATGGTSYTYQVRAMYQTANNGTAYGAWSVGKSVVTLVAPTVKLQKYSSGFKATWNSIRGAVKYVVYYKKSTDSGWSSTETTNLNHTFLNAKKGLTYYVQIRPIGNGVNGPYSKVTSIAF